MDETADDRAAPPGSGFGQRLVWPGLVFVLLGGHVFLVLVTVYLATRDRSFAVEPDYYQKALHWDEAVAQQRENARLGWVVSLEVGGTVGVLGERTIVCTVRDDSGRPIEGARVELVAFAHALASERLSAVLQSERGAAYSAGLRLRRQGIWEFRLVIHRGSETFTHTEQRRV